MQQSAVGEHKASLHDRHPNFSDPSGDSVADVKIEQAVLKRDLGERKASLHDRHPDFSDLFRRFCCSYLLLCPRLPELLLGEEV